jgi:hypothetical protein
MPQLDWSIDIIPSGTGAAFQPHLPNAKPGDPLNAQANDIVTWGNRTSEVHQPWQTDANFDPTGPPLCAPIPPNDSSSPQYVVTGNPGDVIYYFCRNHPTERGKIIVATLP